MFEKFPSIEQYRHIVKELSKRSQFVGKIIDFVDGEVVLGG